MLYDLSNPLQREQFLARASLMAKRGGVAELSSKRQRSLSQNNYLHAIISYFALQYGDSAEYCKSEYFKKAANPELFWVAKRNEIRGEYLTLRSSADLTREEMTTAIERFRNWSSMTAGIYLPSADDLQAMAQIDIELSRAKEFI